MRVCTVRYISCNNRAHCAWHLTDKSLHSRKEKKKTHEDNETDIVKMQQIYMLIIIQRKKSRIVYHGCWQKQYKQKVSHCSYMTNQQPHNHKQTFKTHQIVVI
jgi:hypothetical protein